MQLPVLLRVARVASCGGSFGRRIVFKAVASL